MRNAFSRRSRSAILALLTLGLALIAACESTTSTEGQSGDITFVFIHQVDGADLTFDITTYTNAAGNSYIIQTLQYYVSNFVLHRADSAQFVMRDFHYRDGKIDDTEVYLLDNVPNGEYTSISFTFGLDEEMNVDGGLPNNQQNNNMEWPEPLGDGYHYMKFEGRYTEDEKALVSFAAHSGISLIDSVRVHRHFEVELPNSAVTVNGKGWQVEVVVNLNEWFSDPNEIDMNSFFPGGMGIMANPAKQDSLIANGPTVFSTGEITELTQ